VFQQEEGAEKTAIVSHMTTPTTDFNIAPSLPTETKESKRK